MVKVGRIELTEAEADRYYMSGKRYFVNNSSIFALSYSTNAGYHSRPIYRSPSGLLTKRGRFFAYDAAAVNHLLGYKLLNED